MNEKKNLSKEVINRKEPNGNDRTEKQSNHFLVAGLHWDSILISCGSCNKLPQIWCLKTKENDCIIVLEAKSLKLVSLS